MQRIHTRNRLDNRIILLYPSFNLVDFAEPYHVAMNFSNPIALTVAPFALAVEPFALAVAPFALQDRSTIKDFLAHLVWA